MQRESTHSQQLSTIKCGHNLKKCLSENTPQHKADLKQESEHSLFVFQVILLGMDVTVLTTTLRSLPSCGTQTAK